MDEYIMIKLSDFSKFPSGRDDNDGDFNGEKYRNSILAPQIKAAKATGKKIEISIDGVLNFGSSFLEEAFGGLVRNGIASKGELKSILRITPDNHRYARYRAVIIRHIEEAKADT